MKIICLPRLKWIAAVLSCLIISGCIGGQSAPTRFYMLEPVPPTSVNPGQVSGRPVVRVSLDPVEVPEYLNRPQIVTHLDRTEYQLDEFNQWVEPLRDNLTRVISENLSEMLAADGIDIISMSRPLETDYTIAIQILRMDGERAKDISLIARWSLFDRTDNFLSLTKRTVIQEAASDNTYQSLVQVQNRLLESLSREIADGIRSVVLQRTGS